MRFMTIAVAATLALGAGMALAACGDDDGGPPATSPPPGTTTTDEPTTTTGGEAAKPRRPAAETIVVRNGAPLGGVAELEYDAGERVRFRVRSDVADEVHVHGYDVTEDVPAGRPTSISFPADIEGIFEVELHGSGEQIAELRVNP